MPSQKDKEFGLDPAGSPPLTDATLPSGVTSSGTVVRSHFPPSYREKYEHSACRRGEGACLRLSRQRLHSRWSQNVSDYYLCCHRLQEAPHSLRIKGQNFGATSGSI